MNASASPPNGPDSGHPPGYRLRRGRNWFMLGLTYASYYLCRYNLQIVAPELKAALGFSNTQYGAIQAGRNGAYAIGQFVNGLFTDRLGGKQAMTIGAIGTVVLNLLFGIVSWSKIGWLFFALLLIRAADGYVQAFGAPGFIKINTAWFRRKERGTFSGIFGAMINLGQTGVGQLAGLLATGFSIPLIFFTITAPPLNWRYMFFVPPVVILIVIVLMNLLVKNHPEEAGYRLVHDEEEAGDDPGQSLGMGEVFRKITANPVVWIVAAAYFCTGFVRAAIYDWWAIYYKEAWDITRQNSTGFFTFMAAWALPVLATLGSLAAGAISDKLMRGRRAPVAAVLYFVQFVCIVLAILMSQHLLYASATMATVLVLGIHTGCNATHSILGSAAAMDLGGRKMAGFASGVIDSFQYFGAMLAGFGLGTLLDYSGVPVAPAATQSGTVSALTKVINPTVWFASMLPWGLLGTVLMVYVWIRHGASGKAGT